MDVQNETIKEFLQLYDRPTLNTIFKLTGIQKTRFFRISNGMEMRLAEYVILKNLIDLKKVKHGKLRNLIELCLEEMNPVELERVEIHLEKILRNSILISGKETKEVLSA